MREENSPRKRSVDGSIQNGYAKKLGLKEQKTQPVRLFVPSYSKAARCGDHRDR